MIVDRFVFFVKPGCHNEFVALIKAEIARFPPPHAPRLYLRPIGQPWSQVVGDWEFENQAESAEYWDAWRATPEADTFYEKFYALLTESGYTWERWELAE